MCMYIYIYITAVTDRLCNASYIVREHEARRSYMELLSLCCGWCTLQGCTIYICGIELLEYCGLLISIIRIPRRMPHFFWASF